MQSDYMNIFNYLFYDVSKDDEVNVLIRELCSLLASIVVKYGELVNELSFADEKGDGFVETVIMLFLRKIMEHLDAVIILAEKCSFSQAEIIVRTLLETVVSFKFILKEDTEKRAAAYYLYHHYEELEKMSYFDDKTSEGKMIKRNMGEKKFEEAANKCRAKKDALIRLIQKNTVFSEIDKLRDNKIKQKQKQFPKKKPYIQWYEMCSNIKSFYGLMENIGWQKYYNSLYGGMSMETHGYNAGMGIISDENALYLKALRDPTNGYNVIELTATFCMSALKDTYTYLQDDEDEKKDFRDYFLEYIARREELRRRYKELFGEVVIS